MRANEIHGCPSSSFLILLIGLQFSDNDIEEGDVPRDYCDPEGSLDLISVVFSRYLSCIPSAIKTLLETMNV